MGDSNLPAATGSQSTQVSLSSRASDFRDLVPVSRTEFAAEILPCLALVAPTGMGEAERTAWLTAAYRALDGIPIGLLQQGCAAAMTKADHPAKIVKAISDEIGAAWARRRRIVSLPVATRIPQLPAPTLPADLIDVDTKTMLARIWPTMADHEPAARDARLPPSLDPNRPCRVPTAEDYRRMGIDIATQSGAQPEPEED